MKGENTIIGQNSPPAQAVRQHRASLAMLASARVGVVHEPRIHVHNRPLNDLVPPGVCSQGGASSGAGENVRSSHRHYSGTRIAHMRCLRQDVAQARPRAASLCCPYAFIPLVICPSLLTKLPRAQVCARSKLQQSLQQAPTQLRTFWLTRPWLSLPTCGSRQGDCRTTITPICVGCPAATNTMARYTADH